MRKAVEFILVFYTLCFFKVEVHAQIDSTSIRIPQLVALQNNQNLVNKAIDGAIYLVRQEYMLESSSGERLGRGILDYFGKTYRIGVLVNRDLWLPSSIREPWRTDPNFKEYEADFEPFCSLTKVKAINSDNDYRVFEIKKLNLESPLTSFKPGVAGLNASDSLPQNGKLLVYYVEEDNSPDESVIKSTNINLNQISWDNEGMAEVKDIQFKDRMILGGALFVEKVSLGKIDIELVAVYTDVEENWVLQAVHPIITNHIPSN
ncbi:hypothetical protein OKW21_004038 [Catalinimonas alkaloidigena]|uniref:hypothetical protein n=1 Tax=Catalinimonas alkaloidigena TaxID=1075417 RepID=UPI00240512B7|nr:hypothetical protein [Catalinimonas alkaloidigena]MDF9798775.1 hypothetical protein [Catalinimonas alkaloidigena]